MKNIITKDMVIKGYNQGLINLILSPNGDGIACSIGDNWFYFGGSMAEAYDNIEEYKSAMLTSDIITEIYETLKHFDETDEDEQLYYYLYLTENLTEVSEKDKITILANNSLLNALHEIEKAEREQNNSFVINGKSVGFKTFLLNAQYNIGKYHAYMGLIEQMDIDLFVEMHERDKEHISNITKAIEQIY